METQEAQKIKALLESRQPNHGLPRPFYHDELLYQAEMEAIWRQGWLFAGHSCQIPNPGDYFLYNVEGDSVIVVRGNDGQVNALYNVCRHRGSVICQEAEGSLKRFICPYHQWTYDLSGNLLLQRGMQEDLDKSQLGLHQAYAREVEGMIFISLAETPVDFNPVEKAIGPVAKPQGLARGKVAKIMDFDVKANWKLVWENNRECYHCNVNHPQYIKANFDHYNADNAIPRVVEHLKRVTTRLEFKLAAQGMSLREETGMTEFPDPERGIWYAANRTPLVEGYVSESMDGKQVAPLMGDYTDPEVGTLRIRSLPNFWIHASCDHSVAVRLTPRGLANTDIRMIWLVDGKAQEGKDYELDKLLPFWLLTAQQDWHICTNQQAGVNSHAYSPGPLSKYKEYNLARFLRWYLQEMRNHIEK
ncbi:MAG: aromatic ring-hydroxylating dioxygenase subunit alpha [Anaerolineae bacterium]|nr:aromatic ring-hydroxylating dioxygenase subunit alpha [Anaerolineae bacterium]